MMACEYCWAYCSPSAFISLATSSANARLVLKSGLSRETNTEKSLKWLFLPSNSQFSRNLSGTESWWIDRKRSACRALAAATRLTRLGLALPSVTRSLVSAKPSAFNFSSICRARRRLKANSATLRALIAPSDLAVCPTSRTIRNFAGSHMVAAGFKAEGLKAAGPRAASLTVWGFAVWDFAMREFAVWGFGEATDFAGVAGFAEVTCFGDLPCFDELLKTSDSQPAALASIGSSTNAAIAARRARRRGQTPKPEPAIFLPDDSNPTSPRAISVRAS